MAYRSGSEIHLLTSFPGTEKRGIIINFCVVVFFIILRRSGDSILKKTLFIQQIRSILDEHRTLMDDWMTNVSHLLTASLSQRARAHVRTRKSSWVVKGPATPQWERASEDRLCNFKGRWPDLLFCLKLTWCPQVDKRLADFYCPRLLLANHLFHVVKIHNSRYIKIFISLFHVYWNYMNLHPTHVHETLYL